jgi:hypothetical protein
MTLQNIDEMSEPPVVGRFYMVPTVYASWVQFSARGAKHIWPVLGPKHDDAKELHFEAVHFHVDARFVSAAVWRRLRDPVRSVSGAPVCATGRRGEAVNDLTVTYRRRQCLRQSPGHLGTRADESLSPNRLVDTIFGKMWDNYLGKQCPKGPQGWICPHKGLALGSIQPESDGTIVCPLHGLRIDATSGIVVPTVQSRGEEA